MAKNKKIEIMAQGQKKMYTIFIVIILILFVLTSIYTNLGKIFVQYDDFVLKSRPKFNFLK